MGGGHLLRTMVAGLGAAATAAAMRQVVLDLPPIPAAILGLAPAGVVYLLLALALRVPEAPVLLGPLRRFRRRG